MSEYPILYSFRRCPFAMRVRLVLHACEITCELREVILKDKPQEMVAISAKATVPVLQLPDAKIIDESYDIILWAIKQNDPNNWTSHLDELAHLVKINDDEFKIHLDKYKYSSRHPELPKEEHRENANFFLKYLDELLDKKAFLSADHQTVTDLSIFPFIRQFAFVDKNYFDQLDFPRLQRWLDWHLNSTLFDKVMQKYVRWEEGQTKTFFA